MTEMGALRLGSSRRIIAAQSVPGPIIADLRSATYAATRGTAELGDTTLKSRAR